MAKRKKKPLAQSKPFRVRAARFSDEDEAERCLSRQGYGLITLDHRPDLTEFYARLGYAHGAQLVIHTPGPLIAQPAHTGMIHSFKRQTSAGATTPNSRRRCSTPACSAVSSLTAPFCNSRAH